MDETCLIPCKQVPLCLLYRPQYSHHKLHVKPNVLLAHCHNLTAIRCEYLLGRWVLCALHAPSFQALHWKRKAANAGFDSLWLVSSFLLSCPWLGAVLGA